MGDCQAAEQGGGHATVDSEDGTVRDALRPRNRRGMMIFLCNSV